MHRWRLSRKRRGSVTTDPVHLAPTLGLPLIFLLAVALAAVAVYRLRPAAAGPIAGFVLVAGLTVLAGLGYAVIPTITISGADCTKQTISVFDPNGPATTLRSNCPNPIKIVDITSSCDTRDIVFNSQTGTTTLASCEIGQTLANGDACSLPNCPL